MNWDNYQNIKDAIDTTEHEYPDRIILKYMKKKETVEIHSDQFYDDLHRYASVFVREGLAGKHLAFIGTNSYEYFVMFCASLYVGSVAVLLSKDYTPQEIRHYSDFTDVDALIYSNELEERCLKAELTCPMMAMLATDQPGILSMEEEMKKGILPIENHKKKEDLCYILFTSGTTGEAKAVMHSNGSLLAGVVESFFPERYFASYLAVFPFHHIGGHGVALNSFFIGSTICLGDDLTKVIRYLKALKPEYLFAVPALTEIICQKLRNHSQKELGWNIKVLGSGGAKSQASQIGFLIEKGIGVFQSYSSSELCARGINDFVKLDDLDCLGRGGKFIEPKIIDGELVLRGPSIFMGYYKNPEETKETLVDGWYHTGDMARIEEDGRIYLTGRKKNLIILSNGENISPEELENELYKYPQIQEVLVREEEDRIGALIYPNLSEFADGEPMEKIEERIRELVDQYNEEALSYKQIHLVTVSDQPLPKTATKKILRK